MAYKALVEQLLKIPGDRVTVGDFEERPSGGWQEYKLITTPVRLSITYMIATNSSGDDGAPYNVNVSVLPQQEGGKARGKSKTVHTGKNGGKYRIINGNKVYLKK
jgi:hypothetical protein